MLPAGKRRGSPTGGGNFHIFKLSDLLLSLSSVLDTPELPRDRARQICRNQHRDDPERGVQRERDDDRHDASDHEDPKVSGPVALGLLSEVSAASSQNLHGCLPPDARYGSSVSLVGKAARGRSSSNPRKQRLLRRSSYGIRHPIDTGGASESHRPFRARVVDREHGVVAATVSSMAICSCRASSRPSGSAVAPIGHRYRTSRWRCSERA